MGGYEAKMKIITINLPVIITEAIDKIHPNRSEWIRQALDEFLEAEYEFLKKIGGGRRDKKFGFF